MKSDRFRAAAEAQGLLARSSEIFAEDVTFKSPVVFKPYRGPRGGRR